MASSYLQCCATITNKSSTFPPSQMENLYLFAAIPHSFFTPAGLVTKNMLPIYLWICLFWIFHINGITRYVAFCVWLLLYVFKNHLYSSMYQQFIPFYGWVIVHCTDTPRSIYAFICWWTLGFLDLIFASLHGNRNLWKEHTALLLMQVLSTSHTVNVFYSQSSVNMSWH